MTGLEVVLSHLTLERWELGRAGHVLNVVTIRNGAIEMEAKREMKDIAADIVKT